MTYPIKIYGVEMYSVRGWEVLRNSLNFDRAWCEDQILDYTSVYHLDANDFRVKDLLVIPAGENDD